MKQRRSHPEEALQKAVVQFLERALPSDAVFWATPNQRGTRARWENALLKALGVRAGFPDLAILWAERLYLIELKAAGRGLSDKQKDLHPRLRDAGAYVTTCRTPEQVETYLDLCGIPLKARLA